MRGYEGSPGKEHDGDVTARGRSAALAVPTRWPTRRGIRQ